MGLSRMNDAIKVDLIKAAPKCCRWCLDNEEITWTEFLATFGEKVYLVDSKIGSIVKSNFLSCECTRCGAIEEVHD